MRTLLLLLALAVPAMAAPVDELKTHVEYLADDARDGRWPGSKGIQEAQDYIRKECKADGLKTYTQEVATRGTDCLNVIAVIPGRTETRIVVGAHLDHMGKKRGNVYNGADDNASGSAVILLMAKNLRDTGCTIEIHWYTGEEEGMTGSKAYVKRPLVPIKNYKFMLNLDMVGRLKNTGMYGSDFEFESVLDKLYKKYDFASKITYTENTNDSDHASWWAVGVTSVILHTGLHSDYHKPTDDSNKINYKGMVKVYKYAMDLVQGVDQTLSPSKPVDVSYILR